MEFQFDFRKNHHGSWCAVSSNACSIPSWVQQNISNWKTGDTFRVLSKNTVNGVSVFEEKTFKLEVIETKKGQY